MKKKFIFVLAIVLIVCTLSIALVGCSPKNPEPFKAYDKNATLTSIMEAWTEKNVSVTNDTLGLDIKLNLKNEDTDLVIALKGGLTKIDANSDKEGISFSLQNNKLQTANKNVLNVLICKSGLYFDIAGYTDKTIRVSDFSLPLNELKSLSFDTIVETIKSILFTFIAEGVDEITIDPIMNGKNVYDVTYSFDIVFSKVIDSVVELLSNFDDSISGTNSTIIQIKEAIGDLKLQVSATTTGNKRAKAEKPKKDQPKYNYEGGTLSDFTLTASKDGASIAIGNEIKLQDTLPELTVPSDYVELEAALFPSNVNGSIVMKNAAGNAVCKYDYTANIDFDVNNLYTAFVESLSKNSMAPLLDKMFKQSSGKIFVEITHANDNCTLNHLESNNRPILTIAYDPENFGANRIYFAVNTRAIVTSDFGEKLAKYLPENSTKTANDIVAMLPQNDLIFSIDPTAYVDFENAKMPAIPQPNILLGAVSTLSSEKEIINIKQIIDMILSLDELEGKEQMIKDIVSIVLPEVQTLEVSYERTQNPIADNLKEKFVENRDFAKQTLIGSKITFAEQFAGIVKITSDKVQNLYESNDFRSLTIEEINSLIGATVTGNFTALDSSQKSEQMTITDIIGVNELDLQATGKQTLYLVVGGELGGNLYDFTASVYEVFGTQNSLELANMKDFRFVEAVIKIEITLAV